MTISWRRVLFASLLCTLAQPVTSQTVSMLPERVARLPDNDFRAWFSTMLGMGYRRGTDWQTFFGDVGPTEGCSALRDIKRLVVERDLTAFKAAYVDAVSKHMMPTVFSNIPDNRLSPLLSSRINRFERNLSVFLKPRVLEVGEAAHEWAVDHGYHGRRLGYNDAGTPFWGTQPAMTTLVCIFPDDAGLLRDWKE